MVVSFSDVVKFLVRVLFSSLSRQSTVKHTPSGIPRCGKGLHERGEGLNTSPRDKAPGHRPLCSRPPPGLSPLELP